MLFESSFRRELARSFGATLVVLFTIVLTMLLIRTLGAAAKGSVNPQEILLVLGYTVLGRLPTLLTLALFVAVVSALSRLYRDSEMVIWQAAGQSMWDFTRPILRFSWPIWLAIAVLVVFAWPWANQQTDELRERFERRSDLDRVAPGQFQESADGKRVFFIEKNTGADQQGRHIFIATQEPDGSETVTSALAGRIEWREREQGQGQQQMLVLERGQRLEIQASGLGHRLTEFESYTLRVGENDPTAAAGQGLKSRPTWTLVQDPNPVNLGELSWRLGLAWSAVNFALLALVSTSANPRAGRSGNLGFTLLAFVLYFNLLNLGQSWVANGRLGFWPLLLGLHGGVMAWVLLWLYKRQHQLSLRTALRRLWPAHTSQIA